MLTGITSEVVVCFFHDKQFLFFAHINLLYKRELPPRAFCKSIHAILPLLPYWYALPQTLNIYHIQGICDIRIFTPHHQHILSMPFHLPKSFQILPYFMPLVYNSFIFFNCFKYCIRYLWHYCITVCFYTFVSPFRKGNTV